MAFNNKIFKNEAIARYSMTSRDRYNRSQLFSSDAYKSLNTYLNMGIFPTMNDVTQMAWDPNTGEELPAGTIDNNDMAGAPGVRSIFSKQSAVLTGANGGNDVDGWDAKAMRRASRTKQWEQVQKRVHKATIYRKYQNAPLMDSPETRKELRELGACSVRDLIEASKKGVFGRCGYQYSDFMYCKYLGTVPNNYLITVRRFAGAVGDGIMPQGMGSMRSKKNYKYNGSTPIGTMCTWMGVSGNEMANILKYSYKMSFKEEHAQWEDPIDLGGGEGGPLNAIEAAFNPQTRMAFNSGSGVPAMGWFTGLFGVTNGQYPSPNDPRYRTKNHLYPEMIDNVNTIYRRGQDGLQFDWKFDLVFEYELRAYNGINPRQAMLDLLSSILSVTYTKGGFWGGGYWPTQYPQMSTFRNLNIFKAHGSATGYWDAFMADLKGVGAKAKNMIDSQGGLLNAIKNALNVVGGMLIGGLLNNMGRPKKYVYPALFKDVPVGFWHITIGNPKRPIVSVGNMILTNTTIEQSGPLGLDDFPTNIKVTMSFDRGRPKDKWKIEQMYMRGDDRIALSMSNAILDMYSSAQNYKGTSNNTAAPVDIKDADAIEVKTSKVHRPVRDNTQTRKTQAAERGKIKKENEAPVENNEAVGQEITKTHAMEITLADGKDVSASDVMPSAELIEAFGDVDAYAILEPAMEMAQGFHDKPKEEETKPNNSAKPDPKAQPQTRPNPKKK